TSTGRLQVDSRETNHLKRANASPRHLTRPTPGRPRSFITHDGEGCGAAAHCAMVAALLWRTVLVSPSTSPPISEQQSMHPMLSRHAWTWSTTQPTSPIAAIKSQRKARKFLSSTLQRAQSAEA